MNTLEVVKLFAGLGLISYGLGFYFYSKLHYMKLYDQMREFFSSKFYIVCGVFVMCA